MKPKSLLQRIVCFTRWLLALALLPLPSVGRAQLTFATNNGSITITGYTGNPTDLNIPSTTNGYPVTSIGETSFFNCLSLTSVRIPNSVTNIGSEAFARCFNLNYLTLGSGVTSIGGYAFVNCYSLASVTISNSPANIGSEAFYYCSGLINLNLGSKVTSIDDEAFAECSSLSRVTIPNSVTNIGSGAFNYCTELSGIYFQGNSPTPTNDSSVFAGDSATVYYLPGATGWGPLFDGLPTVSRNPQVPNDASFGVRTNQFGFNIAGASNLVVVVEACTNLANPAWQAVSTNVLTGGLSYFGDPLWTNYSGRFYRFVSP